MREIRPGTGLIATLLATALGACAVSDEGATDFRQVAVQADGTARMVKDIEPGQAARPIEEGEPLLVSLKSGYIEDFNEIFGSLLREGGPNGEIAVVANVYEDDGRALEFGPKGLANGRVVYFSDDVEKGQFLNFHDLPLYGPLRYGGNALVLDLYVVELDLPGDQLRALLGNLAKIGATFAVPASPLAGPLAELAGSLIADEQDDRHLHYTMHLRPEGGADGVRYAVLQAGYVPLVREGVRQADTDWNRIHLNPMVGRLVDVGASGCAGAASAEEPPPACLYRANSYLVVEINRARSSLANDRQQAVYSALRAEFAAGSPAIMRADGVSADTLASLSVALRQREGADTARQEVDVLRSRNSSEAQRKAASARLVDQWYEGAADPAKNKPATFSAQEEQRLLRFFARRVAECTNDETQASAALKALRDRDPGARTSLVTQISCAAV
ncbi:MAG TPA: hypothetical protein PKA13_21625 [Geminicoccaceae bacterium]|nr:hypothetical protein [Geminicoccus sp.]HMU52395.1 hypothetical protein [Geminicoccaceae bacterium]